MPIDTLEYNSTAEIGNTEQNLLSFTGPIAKRSNRINTRYAVYQFDF
jgi:hypothetical protein